MVIDIVKDRLMVSRSFLLLVAGSKGMVNPAQESSIANTAVLSNSLMDQSNCLSLARHRR